jgi:hypothetical protein
VLGIGLDTCQVAGNDDEGVFSEGLVLKYVPENIVEGGPDLFCSVFAEIQMVLLMTSAGRRDLVAAADSVKPGV